MSKIKTIIVREVKDYKLLLRNAPTVTMIFFVLSVVFITFLQEKSYLILIISLSIADFCFHG